VALSIDGTKKSGAHTVDLPIPPGLFEREALVNCGGRCCVDSRWSARRLKRKSWLTAFSSPGSATAFAAAARNRESSVHLRYIAKAFKDLGVVRQCPA